MNSFNHHVKSVIRSYSKKYKEGYYLSVDQIPLSELKIFLSHLLPAEDYEDSLQNPTRTQEYISELRDEIQYYINCEIDNVFTEDMEDSGLYLFRHMDGDRTWARR